MQNELVHTKEELQGLYIKMQELDDCNSATTGELKETNIKLMAAYTKIEELQKELCITTENVQKLQSDLETVKRERDEANTFLEESKLSRVKELDRLNADKQGAEEALEKTKNELENCNNELQKLIKENEAIIKIKDSYLSIQKKRDCLLGEIQVIFCIIAIM